MRVWTWSRTEIWVTGDGDAFECKQVTGLPWRRSCDITCPHYALTVEWRKLDQGVRKDFTKLNTDKSHTLSSIWAAYTSRWSERRARQALKMRCMKGISVKRARDWALRNIRKIQVWWTLTAWHLAAGERRFRRVEMDKVTWIYWRLGREYCH